jgi:glycosyltransferase involved in cell wall biosynthesis
LPELIEVVEGCRGFGLDVLVVNDGSGEDVNKICESIGVYCLDLGRNFGKGYALKEGFKWGLERDYEIFITLDGDGQHNPKHIPEFLKLSESFDIVIGSRRKSIKKMEFKRWLSNRITSSFISVMTGRRIEDSQSGYRMIKAEVLKRVNLKRNRYDAESELLVKAVWMGFKVGFVPIDVIRSEKSFIQPFRDIFLAISLALELILSKA